MQEGFGRLDVAIYGDDAGVIARATEVLGPPFRVTPFEELIALTSDLDRFHCLVMATLRPTDTDLEWMRRRAASPAHSYVPLVLIHSSRPDTEAKLRGIALDDHIRPGEVGAELRSIVRRLAVRVSSANLIRDSSLPDILRRVLVVTCYDEPVPVRLNKVYRLSQTARSTARLKYSQVIRPRTLRSLEDVHEEISIIRCVGWKSPRKSWLDIAERLRCSVDWIDHALKRQFKLARRELDDARIERLQLERLPRLLRGILLHENSS